MNFCRVGSEVQTHKIPKVVALHTLIPVFNLTVIVYDDFVFIANFNVPCKIKHIHEQLKILFNLASKQAYSIKRHEETEKWNEMKDE